MFKEARLVYDVLQRKQDAVERLSFWLLNRPLSFKQTGPRYYTAALGGIRVCMDIYGPEVTLGWKPFARLLDLDPSYYGLTTADAITLYESILSCVPGTTNYNKKVRLT